MKISESSKNDQRHKKTNFGKREPKEQMPFGYYAAKTFIWSDFGFLDTSVPTEQDKVYAID